MNAPTRDPLLDPFGLYVRAERLYKSGGLPRGSSTGWSTLDDCYTVAPSQWTVVTGIPNSGKSEFLDAMLVNMAEAADWLFAMYSPENYPPEGHLAKLAEKRARKPFNDGLTPRMSAQEFNAASMWVLERFMWLDTELKSPETLIEAATRYVVPGRRLGVVLDPWNTLEHKRGGMNETDYVSFVLTEVTKLAHESGAHIWLVVHPAKIPRNKDGTRPVPTPYDISGSAHWYNKPDNILCVHRDQAEGSQDVEIHVQKIRFKNVGHTGVATLKYDKVTGRYFEGGGTIIDPITGTAELYMDPERGRVPPAPVDIEAARERAAIAAA